MDNAGLLESTGVIKPAAMTDVVAPSRTIAAITNPAKGLAILLAVFVNKLFRNAFILFLLKVKVDRRCVNACDVQEINGESVFNNFNENSWFNSDFEYYLLIL